MLPSRVTSRRDRDRIAALAVGLATSVIGWTFTVAFVQEKVDSLFLYPPWLYGVVAIAAWALFSAIAYLLISRDRLQKCCVESHESYHCPDLAATASPNCGSVCANLEQKTRMAAMSAGFALTVSLWVAALSFMPGAFLDWLNEAPAGICCIVSVILWAALSVGMRLVFRASRASLRVRHDWMA
jgi:membrane-associated HD superfamily phosphohydrolase